MFKMISYNSFLGIFVYLILLHLSSNTSIVQILHKDCTQYGVSLIGFLRKRYYLLAFEESTLILIEQILHARHCTSYFINVTISSS